MTHHHHHGSEAHPSPAISPSLLRMSLPGRLSIAGGLVVLLWLAAWWGTR
jgi:hypothetical protein